MKNFVQELKQRILFEFRAGDRKGVYALTQKLMAYNSNRIEGSTLTSEQTASLFDTGTVVSYGACVYRAKDVEETTGHFKMLNEILKNLDKPLTSEMIKSFHYQLKAGVFEDYANGYPVGEFKNRANQVSDIVTSAPADVEAQIEHLIAMYSESAQGLPEIAYFHANYEHIHPFQDGNGRTGRAILLKQCLDSNIVPVIILDNDKPLYYHALHIAQTQDSYTELISLFETSQQHYYDAVKPYIDP